MYTFIQDTCPCGKTSEEYVRGAPGAKGWRYYRFYHDGHPRYLAACSEECESRAIAHGYAWAKELHTCMDEEINRAVFVEVTE